jgi:hypothetical protein
MSIVAAVRGRRIVQPRRPTRAQVWYAVRKADWWDRSFAVFLLCVAVLSCPMAGWAARDGWDGLRAEVGGIPGTVALRGCAENTGSREPPFLTSRWSCTGTFMADGSDLRIDRVRVFVRADGRPGPTVPARAGGASATQLWVDDRIDWIFALLLAASTPFAVWLLLRLAVSTVKPPAGWRNPPRPRRAAPHPPQVGNRARRRRR